MKRLLALVLTFIFVLSILPASLGSLSVFAKEKTPIKTQGTIYTTEMIATARENISKYDWAKTTSVAFAKKADAFMEKSFADVVSLIPSEELWRSYYVNNSDGCPNCGMENYNNGNQYAWSYDNPWKVTCPTCKMVFPANDFESYYKSGLDENGNFHHKNADKSLLVNTLYPDKPKDWCVDDGKGMVNEKGQVFSAIGYCVNRLWYQAFNILNYTTPAYLYTGQQKYADFSIVILDRMADLYPKMDVLYEQTHPHYMSSNGGSAGKGKIFGKIEEANYAKYFAMYYDAVFTAFPSMSADTLNFINSYSRIKKADYNEIMYNVEQGLIMQIFPNIKNGNINGNMGMQQNVLATTAKCIDDVEYTKPWLDFVFQSGNGGTTGGNMNNLLVDIIDRDGMGNEAAPSYNSGWLSNFIGVADTLRGYTIKNTNISYDMYNNPKFKKMFLGMYNLLISDAFTPHIGDTAQTGDQNNYAKVEYILSAYDVYGDYVYAQAIYDLLDGDVSGLNTGIYTKNPEAIRTKILNDIEKYGEYVPSSFTLSGYGFTALKNRGTVISNGETPIENAVLKPADLTFSQDDGITFANDLVSFKSNKSKTAFHIGFSWEYIAQTYELIFNIDKSSKGTFNVFLDGKLVQENISADNIENVFFNRTIVLEPGYHLITLETVSEDFALNLKTLSFFLQTSTDYNDKSSSTYETTVGIYDGMNYGHGHKDALNLFLYAFNVDLSPDMGTPEYKNSTNAHRFQVVNSTLSHNTVVVDDYSQNGEIRIGNTLHYADGDYVQLVDLDATPVYAQCSLYARTVANIKISETQSYVLDIFRVKGGNQHKYSFHTTQASAVETTGLNLIKQTDENGNFVGTYAGSYIPFGTVDANGGTLHNTTGYQWYTNVEKDQTPSGQFSFDWTLDDVYKYATNLQDELHLKMTVLGDYTEVALTDGTPPRNKVGNPKSMDYVFITNVPKNKETAFVSVFEPYDSAVGSQITSIEPLSITKNGKVVDSYLIKAVKVTLQNGRVDYIVCSYDKESTYRIGDLFDFCGYFGVYTEFNGQTVTWMHDATKLGDTIATASLDGKITDFTQELTVENEITVKFNSQTVTPESLVGAYFRGEENGYSQNPFYKIESVKKNANGTYTLGIGDITLVNKYLNGVPGDKYEYNVSKNQPFTIASTFVAGDPSILFNSGAGSTISNVVLSHEIRKGAKKGDVVGNLFVVDSAVTDPTKLPAYTLSISPNSIDGEYFTIDGNKLVLNKDSDKTSYSIIICATSADSPSAVHETTLSIRQTSKEQLYYDFTPSLSLLKQTYQSTGDANENTDDDHQDDGDSSMLIIIVAVALVALVAIVAVIIILCKKKKNATK